MIKFIFVPRDGSSELAHDPLHRVIGLTLLLIDANTFFIKCYSLSEALKKRVRLVLECNPACIWESTGRSDWKPTCIHWICASYFHSHHELRVTR